MINNNNNDDNNNNKNNNNNNNNNNKHNNFDIIWRWLRCEWCSGTLLGVEMVRRDARSSGAPLDTFVS